MLDKLNDWTGVQWVVGQGYVTNWRRWWAWRPVRTVSGQRIWFTWCYSRYRLEISRSDLYAHQRVYEYATAFDLLKE